MQIIASLNKELDSTKRKASQLEEKLVDAESLRKV